MGRCVRLRRRLIKHLIVLTELATPPGVAILPREIVSKPYHLFLPSFLLQSQRFRGVAPNLWQTPSGDFSALHMEWGGGGVQHGQRHKDSKVAFYSLVSSHSRLVMIKCSWGCQVVVVRTFNPSTWEAEAG